MPVHISCPWPQCGVLIHRCRIVVGVLKGYDQLMNLVLDDVEETLRGESIPCCQDANLHKQTNF